MSRAIPTFPLFQTFSINLLPSLAVTPLILPNHRPPERLQLFLKFPLRSSIPQATLQPTQVNLTRVIPPSPRSPDSLILPVASPFSASYHFEPSLRKLRSQKPFRRNPIQPSSFLYTTETSCSFFRLLARSSLLFRSSPPIPPLVPLPHDITIAVPLPPWIRQEAIVKLHLGACLS